MKNDVDASIELTAVTVIEVVFKLAYTPNGSNAIGDIQNNAAANFQANGFVSGAISNLYIQSTPTAVPSTQPIAASTMEPSVEPTEQAIAASRSELFSVPEHRQNDRESSMETTTAKNTKVMSSPKPAARVRDQSVSLGAFKVKKSKKDGGVVAIIPIAGGGNGAKGTSSPSISTRPSSNQKKFKAKSKNPVMSSLTGTSSLSKDNLYCSDTLSWQVPFTAAILASTSVTNKVLTIVSCTDVVRRKLLEMKNDVDASIELTAVTVIEVVFKLAYTPNGSNAIGDIQNNAAANFQANGFVSGAISNLYIQSTPTAVPSTQPIAASTMEPSVEPTEQAIAS